MYVRLIASSSYVGLQRKYLVYHRISKFAFAVLFALQCFPSVVWGFLCMSSSDLVYLITVA